MNVVFGCAVNKSYLVSSIKSGSSTYFIHTMKIKILFSIILMFIAKGLYAQLFIEKIACTGAKIVKTSYERTPGNGKSKYWMLDSLDGLGRVIERRAYKNKQLLKKEFYRYNTQNDIIAAIITDDINHPDRVDTTTYDYDYQNNQIVLQKMVTSRRDSTVVKMLKNEGDSLVVYQSTAYYHVAGKNAVSETKKTYRLRFDGKNMAMLETIDSNGQHEVVQYGRDATGKLIRKKISGQPKDAIMLGSMAQPNQEYQFEYDRLGRLTAMRTAGNARNYRLVSYAYR